MYIKIEGLMREGDAVLMRDRYPSDSSVVIGRLTIVEGGNIAAEIQVTRDLSPVLRAWLATMEDR